MTALDPLANLARWVTWCYEARGPEGKLTKIPHGSGGKPAKADDCSTWLTRAEAEALAAKIVNERGGGVGLELGDLGFDQHVIGFDLDSCISRANGSATIAPWAQQLLEAIPSYAEISPSGNGIKLLAYAATEDVRPFLNLIGVHPDPIKISRFLTLRSRVSSRPQPRRER
jgi:putative DNA primase/helicase